MNIDDRKIEYDSANERLTITFKYNSPIGHNPKIFIKPSEDYGTYDQSRGTSAYNDFLTILREGSLSITNNNLSENGIQKYTFKFGEGDNYSNGFHVKLSNIGLPIGVNGLVAAEQIVFDVEYTGVEPLRIGFEVY